MKPEASISLWTCLIDMRFSTREIESAVRLLLSPAERTEAKPECHSCSIMRDAVDQDRVRYTEVWTSEARFREHARSDEFRYILAAMDMCSEEPELTIGVLSGQNGLAYLQELRLSFDGDTEKSMNPRFKE